MLVSFAALVAERGRRGAAAGAFTCYDLETARGVLRAAGEVDAPVILLVSPQSFRRPGGDALLAALRAAADLAPGPACVQLDHVDDLALIERAFDLGAGAVMADGSKLPLEENVAFVRAAAERARAVGGGVEAELGRVEGDEDVAAAAEAGQLTDPHEARDFVEQTGAACLAVSIGNVHGTYARPPELDWPRLDALREQVTVPISLHGASGLEESDVQRAIRAGVAKINVNTELRGRYLAVTAERLDAVREGSRLLELHEAQTDAVASAAAAMLRAYDASRAGVSSGA